MVAVGESAPVIARYQEIAMDRSTAVLEVSDRARPFPQLTRRVEFLTLEMESSPTRLVPPADDITLNVTVRGNESTEGFFFGLTVFRIDGTPVGSCWGPTIDPIRKGDVATFKLRLTEPQLAPGLYCFALGITTAKDIALYEDLDVVLDVLHFEVLSPPTHETGERRWAGSWGSVRFRPLAASRLE